MSILVFTGHRPQGLPPRHLLGRVWDGITEYLENNRPDHARCGMAMGFDLMCAQVCHELSIPYTAYLPFAAQADRFTWEWQERHALALDRAADVVLCSEDYYEGCLLDRNGVMLSGVLVATKFRPTTDTGAPPATAVLSCLKPGTKKGGTFHCVNLARQMKIPTTNVWSS
jgi:hypothetical protein